MATLSELDPIPVPAASPIQEDGMVCVARSNPRAKYIVPFAGELYTVPIENVWLLPKFVNRVAVTARSVVDLLERSQAFLWRRRLQWGKIAVLRGIEGLQLYTTFRVEGVECEERILHRVPSDLVEEIFASMAIPHKTGEFIDGRWQSGPADCTNHQRNARRADIYLWTKAAQMPDHDGLSPVRNGWPIARGADRVQSCSYEVIGTQQHERRARLVPPSLPPSQGQGNPGAGRGRDALREVEAELFDVREHMSENAYLRISNALKRTFDQM
jgi:hypothetical protein